MNRVDLIGRLTRDPEARRGENTSIVSFSIAIDRGKGRDGVDRGTDFPRITVFGRQAEVCEQYLSKGDMVAIVGRIQTGSYVNKNGEKVYTTDVVADRVEFIGGSNGKNDAYGERNNAGGGFGRQSDNSRENGDNEQVQMNGWQEIKDEDFPF